MGDMERQGAEQSASYETEADISAAITTLEESLDALYRQRAGRLIEGRVGEGWCVVCGRMPVDCSQGFDTCLVCRAWRSSSQAKRDVAPRPKGHS